MCLVNRSRSASPSRWFYDSGFQCGLWGEQCRWWWGSRSWCRDRHEETAVLLVTDRRRRPRPQSAAYDPPAPPTGWPAVSEGTAHATNSVGSEITGSSELKQRAVVIHKNLKKWFEISCVYLHIICFWLHNWSELSCFIFFLMKICCMNLHQENIVCYICLHVASLVFWLLLLVVTVLLLRAWSIYRRWRWNTMNCDKHSVIRLLTQTTIMVCLMSLNYLEQLTNFHSLQINISLLHIHNKTRCLWYFSDGIQWWKTSFSLCCTSQGFILLHFVLDKSSTTEHCSQYCLISHFGHTWQFKDDVIMINRSRSTPHKRRCGITWGWFSHFLL